MAFFFALVESLSSPLLNRGSLFHVLIPGVSWLHQTTSQGIVIVCTSLSSLATLSLNFILPITPRSLLENSCNQVCQLIIVIFTLSK